MGYQSEWWTSADTILSSEESISNVCDDDDESWQLFHWIVKQKRKQIFA